jgi:hypothetical protein
LPKRCGFALLCHALTTGQPSPANPKGICIMSSNAHLTIARSFTVEPRFQGHPMRGNLPKVSVERKHFLRNPGSNPARDRRIMIRDVVISIFGIISAAIPMMMAAQTILGA